MPDAGRMPTGKELTWAPCSRVSESDGGGAECANVELPLVWNSDAGDTLNLFIKRVGHYGTPSAQLWLLAGGPGGSGADFDNFSKRLADAIPNLEIYFPDHRGTGRSSRLSCPAEEPSSEEGIRITASEWESCVSSVVQNSRLKALTTTQAAHDVSALITVTRRPDVPVFVFGTSYGTYWAQRYLQVTDTQPDGVILDSIVTPELKLRDYSKNWNQVGEKFLDRCGDDAFCAQKLTRQPRALVRQLYADIAGGHCQTLGRPEVVKQALRQMSALLMQSARYRVLIPALFYRAKRCSAADVDAIVHLYQWLGGEGASAPSVTSRLHSELLFLNIGLSELWKAPNAQTAELEAEASTQIFDVGTALGASRLYDRWPRYVEPRANDWVRTDAPMLMMNGSLDTATPDYLVSAVTHHFTASHQKLVLFPNATHNTLISTPIQGGAGKQCAHELMLQFLRNPKAELDTACVSQVEPLTFADDSAVAQEVLGVQSLWD